jgi:hypothetical protein
MLFVRLNLANWGVSRRPSPAQAFVEFTAQPLACAILPKLGRYLTWWATHSPEAAEQKI